MASTASTIRALADAILPSPPDDDTAGAADIAAETFVAHYLSFLRPGVDEILAAALDGAAAVYTATDFAPGLFASLSPADRLHALRALGTHESKELRDLTDVAILLSFGAYYGEWSGQDSSGRVVRRPVGWDLTEYPGPVGYSDLPS